MSAQAEPVPLHRVKFVQDRQRFYLEGIGGEITFHDLAEFSAAAEEMAHESSREMTDYVKDKGTDALTTHAAHVRTLSANIVLLRDGLVPALRIDAGNPVLRKQAVSIFCYIKSEFDAMKLFVL